MKANKKRALIFPALTGILALACLLMGVYLIQGSWKPAESQKIAEESGALQGMLPGMSEDEIRAELNRRVSEGELAISINSVLEFETGESEGLLRIENSEKNHYTMVVEMYLNDTGERIYQSGGIKPGYFLEKARLDQALTKGDYPVTVHFKAYDDDGNYIGEANAETVVRVLN